jgi:uncharacterized surface protein with fasciclin (FAS1) repeats
MLVKILTYHVVSGTYNEAKLRKEVMQGNGMATLKTVQGDMLTVTMEGTDLVVKDEKGATAHITTANVMQSNGIIHVIDSVLQPN